MVKAKKIKENRWRASIYMGKNEYGKKVYKDIYGTTEKECNSKTIDFLYKKENGLLEPITPVLPTPLGPIISTEIIEENKATDDTENDENDKTELKTFGEYYDEWIENRIDIVDTTKQEYLSVKRCHLTPLLDIEITELKQSTFTNFFKDLHKEKSAKTVKKVYRFIHTFLTQIDDEYINTRLLKKVTLPKTFKFKPYKVKEQQYMEFINILKKEYDTNSRIWYLYILLFLCGGLGLRIGEAMALTYDDIDFENKTIKIFKEQTKIKGKGHIIQESTKTDDSIRTTAIPKFVYDVLKQDYIKRQKLISDAKKLNLNINKKMIYIDKNNKETYLDTKELLICSNNLGSIAKNTVQRNWKIFREKMGYKEQIRVHDFRRFLATLLMKNNIPDSISRLQLGHSDENMTRYYQNADEELLVNYIKNININI